MLPKALKRAEGPAETLFRKPRHRIRRFGPGDRFLIEENFIALSLNHDRQILILSECVGRKAAEPRNGLAPPGADSPWHNGYAAERRKRPAFEILRRDVFEGLPPGQHINAVADLGVASDGANCRVGEPAHETRYGLGLELRIGVEHHDDVAVGMSQPEIDGASFAPVLRGDQGHSLIVRETRRARRSTCRLSSHRR